MTVTWKLFWASVGAVATLTVGLVLRLAPPVVAVLLTLVVVGVTGVAAAWVVSGAWAFAAVPPRVVRWIIRALGTAAVGHGVWVLVWYFAPGQWLWLLAVLVCLAGVEYGAACAVEYALARPPSRQSARSTGEGGRPLDRPEQVMVAALDHAGYGYVRVVGWEPIGGNDGG